MPLTPLTRTRVRLRLCGLAVLAAGIGILLAPTCQRLAAQNPVKAAPYDKAGYAFLSKHCLNCHGEKTQKAGLALHNYKDEASVLKAAKVWQNIQQMVQTGEMPPKGRPRPAPEEVD